MFCLAGSTAVIHHHVDGDGDAEEFCVSESGLQLGRNYTFQVRLDNNDSKLNGVELTFQTLGQGQYNQKKYVARLRIQGQC
jgi:hypothetical protein